MTAKCGVLRSEHVPGQDDHRHALTCGGENIKQKINIYKKKKIKTVK